MTTFSGHPDSMPASTKAHVDISAPGDTVIAGCDLSHERSVWSDGWWASLAAMVSSLQKPAEKLLGQLPQIGSEQHDAVLAQYRSDWSALWQAWRAEQPIALTPDRYFSHLAWQESQTYRAIVALYQLNARALSAMADAAEGDPATVARLRFLVDQWIAAASPANVFALNPLAQQKIIESEGESLRLGLTNLVNDLQRGQLTQSDPQGFELGKNLATTDGAVIFENDLLQLIQYVPTQTKVYRQPVLIVPPCINKYYILDLTPRNSLVKYALDAGNQVFMISWRNPDESLAGKTWDDYVESILSAAQVVRRILQSAQRAQSAGDEGMPLHGLGFCIGGALLACAAAVDVARRARQGEGASVASRAASSTASASTAADFASLTLLTTMLDYSDTGVLDVFIDEAHVAMRERSIGAKAATNEALAHTSGMQTGPEKPVSTPGLMRAADFANTFSLLRPRDLFWNYVVDNYMLGTTPPAFDLLFWNGDGTHLPGPMFSWYLRHLYLEDSLKVPGKLTVAGEAIDLSTLAMPSFIYGSRDDHIVPWRSAYASMGLLGGQCRFILGASGHIAGVINPPEGKKRHYWRLPAGEGKGNDLSPPDAWVAAAEEVPGSWWPEWSAWLAEQHDGAPDLPADQIHAHPDYAAIERAPGRYVKQRSS